MTQSTGAALKFGWVSLLIVGLGIFVFGAVTVLRPGQENPLYMRALGAASIGIGLFGLTIAAVAYRRRERWAWLTLWYYPLFWAAHLACALPPGKEHIHQVVFLALSIAGLLLPAREFFPTRPRRRK